MSLNIDTIRNYAETGNIALNQQRNGVEKPTLQGLKSFFNIGDARVKNAETLTAIHHAILNDPRFAPKDIQAEAARLLSQVRTDRGIDAAQINGLIRTLDDLTLDTEAAVKARVKAHLAATMPTWAAGHEKEVANLVSGQVLRGRAAAGSYAAIDVSRLAQAAVARIGDAIAHVGDDPVLKDLVFSTLGRTMMAIDNSLASDQKVRQRIDTFRADLASIENRAQRSADPATTRQLGIDFLKTLGKPVHPGVIDAFDDLALSLPVKALGALGPKSSASEIIRAVHRFSEALRTATTAVEYPQGVEPLVGGEELLPAQTYTIRRAISELPAAAQRNILAAFESEEGIGACAYIGSQTGSGRSVWDFNTVSFVSSYIQERSGKPVAYPGGYDRKAYVGSYTPLARCAFNPNHAIAGSASAPLLAAILRPNGFDDSERPAAAMHQKIDAAAKSMISSTFAAEMKKFATGEGKPVFEKDIVRGMKVTLPDGTKLSKDIAKARDQFARLVTGDANATYAALGAADKAKANALMSLLSQETEKAAIIGIPIGLSRTGSQAVFSITTFGTSGPEPERAFDITGSPAEGFMIHYQGRIPSPFLIYDDERGRPQQTPMGQEIVSSFEMEMHISPASLNQVSQTDWSQHDSSASDAILQEKDHPNRLADSLNAIPANFRLGVDVSAGFTILANSAPQAR